MSRALILFITILLVIGSVIPIVHGSAYGYLAIKDYLGKTWTMDDVNKIINYEFTTPDGEKKSLADYFWIVIDDNTTKKYNLRNFTASPLDGKTAVIPLSPGDHYVDIYWFGYHQRQLVHIIENQHYVLNLETAPVVPFKTAGEPPESAEWDLAYSPDGLKIQRKDGNAYVLFKYNTSYIEVGWLDKDLGGWNYQDLDIYIDTSYQYKFHVKDPASPTYYEEGTGSFLWLSWDVYKVEEVVKWNKTGEILHVSYIVTIAENQALLKAHDEFWAAAAEKIIALSQEFIDPITGTIMNIRSWIDFVHSAYDTYMGEFYASKYQKTILLIWEVFATPTQVVVLAHAYDVRSDGTVVKKPITSANAFTINNRLVYIRMLQGGYVFQQYAYVDLSGVSDYSISNSYNFRIVKDPVYGELGILALPTLRRIHVDDLSMYDYVLWYSFSKPLTWKLIIGFDNDEKASAFKNALDSNGISYTVDATGKIFTFTAGSGTLIINEFENIERLIPINSSGYIQFWIDPVAGDNGITGWLKLYYAVMPKLTIPDTSLLKDGYTTVSRAYGVRVYTTMYKEDQDVYMLGYYLLGNDPPPSHIMRDVYYDVEQDVMHYVYTIISADAYGQDITQETGSTRVISQDLYIEAISIGNVQFGIKVYYDRVYYQLPTLSSDEHAFLHIVLKNGTVIKVFDGVQNDPSGTIYYSDYGITFEDILYIISYVENLGSYEGVQIVYSDGTTGVTKWGNGYYLKQQNPPRLEYSLNITPTIRLLENVTFALFNYNKMEFLNLAPDIIQYLLAVPPLPGYGTPVIDWANVQVLTVNLTRPYELYWWKNDTYEWVKVWPDYDSNTTTYYIKRASDNLTIETLPNGTISDYFYKLTYLDNNESYTGYFKNDNGTLKLIAVSVKWSLSPQELQLLLQQIQLKGIYDKWLEQWNKVAKQLGLITEQLSNIASGIAGAWDWLNRNWKWVLVGIAGLFLLMALITRNTSKVVIAGRFR